MGNMEETTGMLPCLPTEMILECLDRAPFSWSHLVLSRELYQLQRGRVERYRREASWRSEGLSGAEVWKECDSSQYLGS